jgi:hypothetical protein
MPVQNRFPAEYRLSNQPGVSQPVSPGQMLLNLMLDLGSAIMGATVSRHSR